MNEADSFIFVGKYTKFDEILNLVLLFDESDWSEFKERKTRGGAASSNTDSIPLIWGKLDTFTGQRQCKDYKLFEYHLNQILSISGFNNVKRAVLARLHPGGVIPRHKDTGVISKATHRIHLPIVTNGKCKFTVGDKTMHIPAGELWIIDNTDKSHSVENLGDEHRIHLIVDVD